MLPPDIIGFILFVIATLVAYLLFHFYKNPYSTSGVNSSPSKKKISPISSVKKSGKTEQYVKPVTGNRSADKVLSSGRKISKLSKQESDTSMKGVPAKWFIEENSFECKRKFQKKS